MQQVEKAKQQQQQQQINKYDEMIENRAPRDSNALSYTHTLICTQR
jgi:hypothetical protein